MDVKDVVYLYGECQLKNIELEVKVKQYEKVLTDTSLLKKQFRHLKEQEKSEKKDKPELKVV